MNQHYDIVLYSNYCNYHKQRKIGIDIFHKCIVVIYLKGKKDWAIYSQLEIPHLRWY